MFLILGLLGLTARLVSLQTVRASHLQELALHQQVGALVLPPARGRIYDRAGRALAGNVGVDSIYAVPRSIRDPAAFARRIAPVLSADSREIERRLAPHLYFAWLKRKVTPQTAAGVRGLALGAQVGFLREARRVYPNGQLAAHALGFVGIDNQGLAGVELAYDEILRGRPGKTVFGRDAVGRRLLETQRLTEARVHGSDLILTIDQVIQHVAERELARAVERTGAARGLVLGLDPTTGEVLALAIAPAFDPEAAGRVAPERWFNRAISQVLEPGSTFKLITAAAALDRGGVTASDRFGCPPALRVAGHAIRDAHRSCRTTQTLADILMHSSNVGAAEVATRIGKPLLHQTIRRFGFGAPTGIDLPGEAAGIIPPPEQWLGPGLQTIAFGQGVSTTPLQLLGAASALANDGVLLRPHVVRMVRDPEGRVVRAVGASPVRRVVSSETARALMEMMVAAVERGTGKQAAVPGYVVAGKTGTAQKPGPTGGYLVGRYISSFLGFAPVPGPRVALLILLDEPRGAYYGGTVAAPVFREIAGRALWHLRVPPTRPLEIAPAPLEIAPRKP